MDIRDVIKGLSASDIDLFADTRRKLRSVYINALSSVVGVGEWSQSDDMFLDAMDIKVIQLFERAGRYNQEKKRETHSGELTAEDLAASSGKVTEAANTAENGNAKEAGTGAVAAALGGDPAAVSRTAAERMRERS